MTGLVGMSARPRVAAGDACPFQCLAAGPKADARSIRRRVEIAGEHDMDGTPTNVLLDAAGGDRGLQLAFVLLVELPLRQVVDEEDPPGRCRGQDLD